MRECTRFLMPTGWKAAPALFLFLAAVPGPGACAVPPDEPGLSREGVTSRVPCVSDPGQTYALYLPPSYEPSHPAPILFLLDARGRAMVPLERFRKGAERLGIILASSCNSASDVAEDFNGPALSAMWRDAAARLSLDGRRIYVGGFSGTARAACGLARGAPEKFAGVIAAGGGFPAGRPPARDVSFAFFGTVGDEDFNYYEMMDLDRLLESLDLPHRVEVFSGGHDWMPEDLGTEALEWMMLKGSPQEDPVRGEAPADSLWNRDMVRARLLEAEGRRREALRLWRGMERDFRDRRDVSAVSAAARRLEASEETLREEREWEERRERETKVLEEAWRVLGSAVSPSAPTVRPAKLAGDLGIAGWRRKAAGGDSEGIAARRVLAALRVQTGFYLSREEEARGNLRGVALLLGWRRRSTPRIPGWPTASRSPRLGPAIMPGRFQPWSAPSSRGSATWNGCRGIRPSIGSVPRPGSGKSRKRWPGGGETPPPGAAASAGGPAGSVTPRASRRARRRRCS